MASMGFIVKEEMHLSPAPARSPLFVICHRSASDLRDWCTCLPAGPITDVLRRLETVRGGVFLSKVSKSLANDPEC